MIRISSLLKTVLFMVVLTTVLPACKKDVCATCYSLDTSNNNRVMDTEKSCAKNESDAEKKAISKLTIKNGYNVSCSADN